MATATRLSLSLLALVLPAGLLLGQKQFAELERYTIPISNGVTRAMTLGDVNGDGALDLVIVTEGASPGTLNELYINDGKGRFIDASKTNLPLDKLQGRAVALGDIDGDRDLDMVVGNWLSTSEPNTRLYLNDGKGRFTDATTRLPTRNVQSMIVAIGDLNGDGHQDIFHGNLISYSRLLLNDGKGGFVDASLTLPQFDGPPRDVAFADVDGDGDLDLVFCRTWRSARSSGNLLLNDGKARFTDVTATHLSTVSVAAQAVGVGDVDGDGDLDLVFANDKPQNQLFLNDGKGKFTDVTATHMPMLHDATVCLGLGDLDGDGDLDLVFGQFLDQQNRMYLNDGKGRFTDVSSTRIPFLAGYTPDIAVGDLDGDGDNDLVIGQVKGKNQILFNLQRQLHARAAPALGRSHPLDVYAEPGYARSYHLVIPFVAMAENSTQVPPFGTFGLDLASTIVLPVRVILPQTGRTTLTLAVPSDARWLGLQVSSQALVIPDLLYPPVGWRFTNVVADKITR